MDVLESLLLAFGLFHHHHDGNVLVLLACCMGIRLKIFSVFYFFFWVDISSRSKPPLDAHLHHQLFFEASTTVVEHIWC